MRNHPDLLDPPNYAFMAANVAAFLFFCAAVWWFLRSLLRSALTPRRDAAAEARAKERLLALEERVEALAEENTRLREAQRFEANLLASRAVGDERAS